MYQTFVKLVEKTIKRQVPATGLGVFRLLFGLVILQEVFYLFYFRHLIFDPIPFADPASPMIDLFLFLWGGAAFHLTIGRHTRIAAIANYLLWITFISFTPMWEDFDGGFDQLMTGTSFLLIFLPTERALSIDRLRLKLNASMTGYPSTIPHLVPVVSYYIPVAFSLGLLYLDSAIHKLFAEFWLNGMGTWLPSSMPYYISAIDMSWLLNNKPLQMFIGYAIIVFEFVFIFLCFFRPFRIPLLSIGVILHVGIVVSFNIYPFGFGMLAHYALMIPFSWWPRIKQGLKPKQPALAVFYNQKCSECERIQIIVEHFDILGAIDFKDSPPYTRKHSEFDRNTENELLTDFYSINGGDGEISYGLDAYIQILFKMKYTAPLGALLSLPGIYQWAKKSHGHIPDGRDRVPSKKIVGEPKSKLIDEDWSVGISNEGDVQRRAHRISRLLIGVFLLQLNSTIHYGILDRFDVRTKATGLARLASTVSDSMIVLSRTFLGITPHGLYMHDHFDGYNHIIGFTYRDKNGREKWLPFVNGEGRIVAPNWGRIQSMWANIAITSQMEEARLHKFAKKVTAFWGTKSGLDISNAEFHIKIKEIDVPVEWERDLRARNLSQPWQSIGKVTWENGVMHVQIPDLDIESL